LPCWLVLLLGVAAVVVGVWLTAEPLRSLSLLVVLVVAGLVLTGAGEIALGRVVAATGCGLTVWGSRSRSGSA
jgi:uncharacterized membrane protein HdeD (DUF308 family)